jgi:DNA polymerase-3 subunit epsilon
MSRRIVLDTETTGLNPSKDRIIEIACLEMVGYDLTGNEFHYYLNPNQRMSKEASEITGISDEFLIDKPDFCTIAQELLNFLSDSTIVAHNASFDKDMLNSEFIRCGFSPLNNPIIDTLQMARKIFPGGNNTLDNLCKKFRVNTRRGLHDALGDAKDLSVVYYYLDIAKGSIGNIQQLEMNSLEINISVKTKIRLNPDYIDENIMKLHQDFCKQNNLTLSLQ